MAVFSHESNNILFKLTGEYTGGSFLYFYNESSIVGLESENYGLISSAETVTEDFGSISEQISDPSQIFEYGSISLDDPIYPFGRIRIVSKVNTEASFVRAHVGGVLFLVYGKGNASTLPIHFGSGYLVAHGLGIEKNTESYVGFGALSNLDNGEQQESTVYSYNESSIVPLDGEDYGYVFNIETSSEDVGSVVDPILLPNQIFDYQSITLETPLRPYGVLNVSDNGATEVFSKPFISSGTLLVKGSADVYTLPIHLGDGNAKIFGAAVEKNTESYVGTGSLFSFVGATESFGANPPESIQLFKFSGSLIESFGKGLYTGSGSLFSFISSSEITSKSESTTGLFKFSGAAVEKNTESYVGTGSLFSVGNLNEATVYSYNESSIVPLDGLDYGLIINSETSNEDYESIVDPIYLPSQIEDYASITLDQPSRPYGRIRISSSAIEKNTESYVGSGTLLTSGEASIFVTPIFVSTGSIIRFSGAAVEKNTESYVGTGSLFGFTGSAESFGANPPESIQLFKFSGSLIESFGKGLYTGSGSLFTFISFTETTSVSESTTGLFKFSGSAVEKNTESYVGTGSLFSVGNLNEATVYSYNESSIVPLDGLDYGFISNLDNSSEDYESIVDPIYLPSQIEDYASITLDQPSRPYGRIRFSGTVIEKNTESYVGSGTLLTSGEASIFVTPIFVSDGSIVRFSGAAVEKNTESYVGTGSLFGFTGSGESFGANPPESIQLFKFSGSVVESFGKGLYTGSGSLFTFISFTETTSVSESTTGLFRFSGSAVEKNTESYVGTGSLFSVGNVNEAKVYSYNESSIVPLDGLDYGFISNLDNSSEDYDLITGSILLSTQIEDYTSITLDQPSRPYGRIRFSGTVIEKNTEDYVGSGTLLTSGEASIFVTPIFVSDGSIVRFSGDAALKSSLSHVGSGSLFGFSSTTEALGANPPESIQLFKFSGSVVESFGKGLYTGSGSLFSFISFTETTSVSESTTGLFKFSGAAVEKNTESYVGTGSLFSVGNVNEAKVYSYNESSIVPLDGLDYGFIANSETSSEDYDLITGSILLSTQIEDYASITLDQPSRPYGRIRISSSTIEKNTESYVGSGTLLTSGEASIFVTPIFESDGSIVRFFGAAVEKNTESYVGSGSLFGIIGSGEAFGANPPESIQLFKFSGSLIESFGKGLYTGTGSLFGFNSSTEVTSKSEFTTGLFKFSGSAVEKNTESYVGKGSLFGIGALGEATTYSYNESSIVNPEGLDYGFIINPVTSSEDYNSIVDNVYYSTDKQNYGFIVDDSNRHPYGRIKFVGSTTFTFNVIQIGSGLVKFSGESVNFKSPTYNGSGSIKIVPSHTLRIDISHIGSGSLFGIIGSGEAFGANPPESIQLFKFSGSVVESTTPAPHVGSGSLFTFISSSEITSKSESSTGLFKFSGVAVEKNTESYVGSGSLFGFDSSTEVASVSESSTGLFKFSGSSIESKTPAPHIGSGSLFSFISFTETTSVSESTTGLFKFSGSSTESTTPAPHVGSGSLFGFTGSGEAFGANPPESIQLFRFSGAAVEKNTESYVGSGSLFSFISFTETTSVSESTTGLFKFSGSVVPKISLSHVGTGSLFGFTGSGEAFGANPPESIQLFRFSGAAVEKNTESYVGTGSLFGFDSSTEVASVSESSTGLFKFSGSVVPKISLSHVGSGSLFGFTGSAESFGANPPESIQLFRFSGSAVEKNTESYVGTGNLLISGESLEFVALKFISDGSIIRFSGSSTESTTPAPHVGSGSLFGFTGSGEAFGANPPESIQLFRFSGSAVEKNSESYVGTGSLFGFDSATESRFVSEVSTGLFKFSGTVIPKISLSHIGSGSLFGFTGSAESFGANPPESIQLFKFSGSAVEKNTESYVGTGSLFGFDSATESVLVSEVSTGLFKFSGSSAESTTPAPHVGSGSLFGIIGSGEAFGANPPESIQLFRFSGSAVEKNSESYVGTGSLFGFDSATESRFVSEVSTGLFKFSGAAVEKNTESYIGTGSLFGFTGSGEAFGANPPESIQLFRFSGAAVEKNTESYVGSGSLFGFDSATESVLVSEVSTGLFDINGGATESFTPATEIGLVQIFERGFARTSRSLTYPAIILDPSGNQIPETINIFVFSGSAVEKNTESYVGAGSLFGFNSSTAVASVSESTTGLFKFSGSSIESTTPAPHVGSGSLFGFTGSAESFGANPPESIQLFKFSGSAVEKNTESYIGTGSLFGFDSATESRFVTEIGSGIFNFVGNASESTTPAPHIGSGSIFGFTGSAESFGANPPESIQLFRFSGSAVEKNTESYVGTGSLFGFDSATEAVAFVTQATTIFTFSGSAVEKNTESYVGSGSLFGFTGSVESILINYKVTQALFTLSSSTTHKVFYNAATNEMRVIVNGQSQDRYIEYGPPQPTRIYII
jgi:hypothetical protein